MNLRSSSSVRPSAKSPMHPLRAGTHVRLPTSPAVWRRLANGGDRARHSFIHVLPVHSFEQAPLLHSHNGPATDKFFIQRSHTFRGRRARPPGLFLMLALSREELVCRRLSLRAAARLRFRRSAPRSPAVFLRLSVPEPFAISPATSAPARRLRRWRPRSTACRQVCLSWRDRLRLRREGSRCSGVNGTAANLLALLLHGARKPQRGPRSPCTRAGTVGTSAAALHEEPAEDAPTRDEMNRDR